LPQLCVWVVRYSPFLGSLKNWKDLSKKNWLRGVILILLIRELIFVEWGFPFPVVMVQVQVIFVSHTIKPDLLGFPGIWCLCVWVAWPCDYEVHIFWYKSLAPLIRLYPFISCIFVFTLRINFFMLSLFRVWSCFK
jgi:hypothetical protein